MSRGEEPIRFCYDQDAWTLSLPVALALLPVLCAGVVVATRLAPRPAG